MWRYLAGGGALLAVAGAGVMALGGSSRPTSALPAAPIARASDATTANAADDPVPEASAATREEKRFGRYDKDRDGKVTREEYLAARRKAFAKLDTDGDGRLSFDEWAIKATTKFAAADRDKSGAMDQPEFATTAVKRKGPARAKCPPRQAAPADEG
ncbi:hypothetical protein FHT00_001190 [Sphingomonas insulae]|uniref:EF-hand domain-containing protein n=1 Tax=Sphingomonas insulae TaxID=424800 RepID=A0ABP3STX5_9SPHN|nr:EF-hand domain-containing protein [Sphingomonas insulae]NIJ29257.1 hypothetical protein [Sphingomonas insulae]